MNGYAAVSRFMEDEQRRLMEAWVAAKDANPEHKEPQPMLLTTDPTMEGLRGPLQAGAVLYCHDEGTAWCQQMGQYKKGGGADKPTWASFWSHKPCHIVRAGGNYYIDHPFVGVACMMVPESAYLLNHQGHGDDGFVHRCLLFNPPRMPPLYSSVGVDEQLSHDFDQAMKKLFRKPVTQGGNLLRLTEEASATAGVWCNQEHYISVQGRGAPDWLVARYKKLFTNLWRIALVLHEVWRVAGTKEELPKGFNPQVVDVATMTRAIAVVDYFKAQIPHVQKYMGEAPKDAVDALYHKFLSEGKVILRDFMQQTGHKTKDKALAVWALWEKRGYGTLATGTRKNQQVFKFAAKKEEPEADEG